jgi:hypothetical protein
MILRLFHQCHDVSYSPSSRGLTNFCYHSAQYGAPSDFDEWAEIAGDQSWSWNNFSKHVVRFSLLLTFDNSVAQIHP